MNIRRTILVLLLALPILVYIGFGLYALWETGWLGWIGWSLPVLWILTWIVAKVWREPTVSRLIETLPADVPDYWTERDQSALTVVRLHQQQAAALTIEQLIDPHVYLSSAVKLATELANHFHPHERDPINGVTALEVLAAMRLAVEDTERWVLKNVPGSQLVTIGQWRWLAGGSKWIEYATNAGWLAATLASPLTVVKYLTSNATVGPVMNDLQREVVMSIYLRFVRQVGFYLIEMNSGRLRGGADVYRQAFYRESAPLAATGGAESVHELKLESLSIVLLGQVKAGKSSLVNALLKDQQAATDVLPKTRNVQRFSCTLPGSTEQITLLDTPGYAEAGATASQVAEIRAAVEAADVVLLVLAAHSPAKSADQELLRQLRIHYQQHPELKAPPVVAVLTHIDLLSPVREWSPPYDWRTPTTPKAESIQGAVQYTQELFGAAIASAVPVCSSDLPGRQVGIFDELVPAVVAQLDAGRSAALLKAYYSHLSRDRMQALLGQLFASGSTVLKWWIEERLLKNTRQSKKT